MAMGPIFLSCAPKIKTSSYSNFTNSHMMKIGFGSCLKQNNPMPIFQSIKADSFDLFLMIGDNVIWKPSENCVKTLDLMINLDIFI